MTELWFVGANRQKGERIGSTENRSWLVDEGRQVSALAGPQIFLLSGAGGSQIGKG